MDEWAEEACREILGPTQKQLVGQLVEGACGFITSACVMTGATSSVFELFTASSVIYAASLQICLLLRLARSSS